MAAKFLSISILNLMAITGSFAGQISAVAPWSGPQSSLVRIYGTGFGTEGTVKIAGRPAPVARWSDSLIECFVPMGSRPGATQIELVGSGATRTRPVTFKVVSSSASLGRLAWRFKAPDQYLGARPAIGPDGTIYAVGNFGHLYALTPNGLLKWVRNDINPSATVDVLPSGNIVCGGGGGISSFTPEGLFRWSFPFSTAIAAGPNVGPDGLIYVIDNLRWGTDVRGMMVLDESGELVWSGNKFYRRGANNNPAEIVFNSGKAYAWSDGTNDPIPSDGGMNAFDLGGGFAWNDPSAVGVQVAAMPSPNVAYCTTTSITMKTPQGSTVWSSQLTAQPQQVVGTSVDGSTYMATSNARLNGWSPSGALKFSNAIGGLINWLSVAPNGQQILVQTSDFTNPARVRAFTPLGVESWAFALPVDNGMNVSVYSYMGFSSGGDRAYFGTAGPYTSSTEAHSYVYALRTE